MKPRSVSARIGVGEMAVKKRVAFTGGVVVKNLPANAGDAGSVPCPGGSHMPWSN